MRRAHEILTVTMDSDCEDRFDSEIMKAANILVLAVAKYYESKAIGPFEKGPVLLEGAFKE